MLGAFDPGGEAGGEVLGCGGADGDLLGAEFGVAAVGQVVPLELMPGWGIGVEQARDQGGGAAAVDGTLQHAPVSFVGRVAGQ